MSKKKSFLLFILSFLLLSIKANATHIVGGEMNYRYLGNNIYEITLTVYRDCYNGIPPFDNPAHVAVYNSDGILVSTTNAYITSQSQVANAINTPCLIPPTNVCYEVATYVYTTVLPPIAGGYTVAYQRCCRNSSIVNLLNVQGTGATYFAHIPDPAISTFDSNPKFVNWPPTFICKDAPFTFDHSAIDFEGDSLVYSISTPYNGGSQSVPIPNPPDPPPYYQVTFANPYSLANELGGTALNINSQTGLLKATPNALGQFVYGVTVKEYRNGIYIGETTRDFQVNVVSCPLITVASIFSPTISCGTLEANFTNTSYNAATYHWDFGENGILNDTSSLMNPSYTYADTGDYMATLVAYSGVDPLCNDTARGLVHIYPVFNSDFLIRNTHCSNNFYFLDQSHGIGGVANYWRWEFGDDSTSSESSPTHIYQTPGTYDVALITSSDSSCYDTLVKKINVLEEPISNFSLTLDTCHYQITTTDSSLFADSYRWDFGDGVLDYTPNPIHSYLAHGNYTIQQIIFTDSTCIDTSYQSVFIPALPIVDFSYSVPVCDSTVSFENQSLNVKESIWTFENGDTTSVDNPQHTYTIAGNIPVSLTGISLYGCEVTETKSIYFVSFKEAKFSSKQDTCSSAIEFYDVTENGVTYNWNFGDGKKSQSKNPIHFYDVPGEYQVKLFVNNESECVDTAISIIISDALLGEIIYLPNSFTPNGDGINDVFSLSTYRPCMIYSIEIYDRWGIKIYENTDAANTEWDGRYKGQMVPADIYVYILKNSEQQRTGMINLIR